MAQLTIEVVKSFEDLSNYKYHNGYTPANWCGRPDPFDSWLNSFFDTWESVRHEMFPQMDEFFLQREAKKLEEMVKDSEGYTNRQFQLVEQIRAFLRELYALKLQLVAYSGHSDLGTVFLMAPSPCFFSVSDSIVHIVKPGCTDAANAVLTRSYHKDIRLFFKPEQVATYFNNSVPWCKRCAI